MTIEKAKKIVLNKYPDSIITTIMLLKDGYLFSIKPIDWDDSEILLQPFFKVSNKGVLSEYSSVANPLEFKEAMKNIIYSNRRKNSKWD